MRRKGRKIIYKTAEEIELIRASCMLVCKTLAYVGSLLRPGMTGEEIDTKAEAFIRDNGALPGFKGLYGCPSTLLVSRNEAVVHGLPSKEQVFADGDILSIDCGVLMNDFYGDAAYTFCVGDVDEATLQLCLVTNESLYLGIEQAVVGNRVGDISYAIQHFTEKVHGYSVVRELVGHGLGRSMHEAPDVPNYGRRGQGPVLSEGMVIAIEPMINLGRKEVRTLRDDWTIVTKDKKPSAHYEHTIAVTQNGPDILSNHEIIVEAIEQNPNIRAIVRETTA
ncbi:MAG: type I methionyl aminopeptidase [Bacteroidetes bacterium]|nr:MAG: type I methionyl aminopeptidase [Bacteroidota bacterium]PTM10520.1 MAG: type I methionyl aminopeptidase [Bacteroidota bacterium]